MNSITVAALTLIPSIALMSASLAIKDTAPPAIAASDCPPYDPDKHVLCDKDHVALCLESICDFPDIAMPKPWDDAKLQPEYASATATQKGQILDLYTKALDDIELCNSDWTDLVFAACRLCWRIDGHPVMDEACVLAHCENPVLSACQEQAEADYYMGAAEILEAAP